MSGVFLFYIRCGLSIGRGSISYGRMNGLVGGMVLRIVRCLMMWDVITLVRIVE